jgi:lambda repressor-like predicted transcriptional regulator
MTDKNNPIIPLLWDKISGDSTLREVKRKEEEAHERRLAEIRAQSHALVWVGEPSELIATITGWYKSGWLQAESLQDGLDRASLHFVRPDRTPVIKPVLPSPAPVPESSEARNSREAFVFPLLDQKGWSPFQWAMEAGVAWHTAADYLSGKIKKPNRSTRMRLAKAIGVDPNRLPK